MSGTSYAGYQRVGRQHKSRKAEDGTRDEKVLYLIGDTGERI
jgi:hypothetical protein